MKKEHSRANRLSDFLRTGGILPTFTVLITMLLIPSVWAAAPTSSAPEASGYEISLGELKKVKKDRPVKKEIKTRRKKIKSESIVERPSSDATEKTEQTNQLPAAAPSVSTGTFSSESQQPTTSENKASSASGKLDTPEISSVPVAIHHDPYSYVITGKRTILQAVISSAESVQTVYCRFRAAESGFYAIVPMVQAPGTQFTYVATVPGLAAASRSLRYSIHAGDSAGNEARTQEFIIPVKPTTALPGWQLEKSPGMIKIKLENRDKPFDGFSDPGIVVE